MEYKLLQLLQYLDGKALRVIEILGHFATAFLYRITGKETWCKGRQVSLCLKELNKFQSIRSEHVNDMEKLADMLDIAVINLCEAGT